MRLLRSALVLALAAATATADDLTAQARRDVEAGLAAQSAGRYDDAIARYKTAFASVPHPEILFNLGQAHRLKGELEAALSYYQQYLSVEPNGRVASDAKRWSAELERTIAAHKAREPREARAQPPPVAAARTTIVTRVAPAEGSPLRTRFAIVVAATGAATLIGGGIAAATARMKLDDALAICGADRHCESNADTARANELLEQSRARGNLATVLVTAGGVALATGAVLWWTARSDRAPPRTAWAVNVTPSSIDVALGGRF